MVDKKQEGPTLEWLDVIKNKWKSIVTVKPEDAQDLINQIERMRRFLEGLRNTVVYNSDLWVNEDNLKKSIQIEGIRSLLNEKTEKANQVLSELIFKTRSMRDLLTPGTKEYETDHGETYKGLRDKLKGGDMDAATFKLLTEFILANLKDSISSIWDVINSLGEVVKIYDTVLKSTHEIKIDYVNNLKVIYKNVDDPDQLDRYRRAMKLVLKRLADKNVDYLFKGIIIINPKSDRKGVRYLSPPKDKILVYEEAKPFIVKGIIYEMGNRYFYKYLDPEKQKEWIPRKKTFAKAFQEYVYNKLKDEDRKEMVSILKQKELKDMINPS
jgi:hypothetical protein